LASRFVRIHSTRQREVSRPPRDFDALDAR
jgi:hypothetical protein